MNSTWNGDGPAQGFELDRIIFEDVNPMQEAARKTSRGWRQDATTVRSPVKADNTGGGAEAADKSEHTATHKARTAEERAKTANDSKRQASPPAPRLSRPEPLHTV